MSSPTTVSSTHSVLLAEDDPDMRMLLSARLRMAGIEAQTASDGRELERLVERRIDDGVPLPAVVISDLCMPGASGLEVLQWLKSRGLDVKVILITAFGDARTHQRARRLGAVAVFDKPFPIGELLDLVSRLMS
jgi:DNA-binding NtrC family response regulator